MANVNNPQGFQCITPNARQNAYTIATGYGTTLNLGDPVAVSGTGVGALPGIVIGVIGSAIVGIFNGVSYTDSNGQPQWSKSWPASTSATNIIANVIDDPFAEFVIQASGSIAVTDYFNDADWSAGAGTLGISGYQLDTTTIGTGTDLQIRRLFNDPGFPQNELGTNAKVVVGLKLHTLNYPYTAV